LKIIEIRVWLAKSKSKQLMKLMAARTTQLAFLVDQLMPALQTKPPVLAGNVFVRRSGTDILTKIVGRI